MIMARNTKSNAYEGGLTVDPSVFPGVPATVGSVYLRVGTTEAWQKFGPANTDWKIVLPPLVPLTTLVFRPGAVGAEAAGDNVFTTWAPLQARLDQT